MSDKLKIVFITRFIPQYRESFFNKLKQALEENNCDFLLIYGQPSDVDALRNDTIDISWAKKIKNRIKKIGNKELYWQPIIKYLQDANLVIVESGSKFLINYILIFWSMIGGPKIAFWGLGKNYHLSETIQISEIIKRITAKFVHWHFAYTNEVADIIENLGFPRERISVVQNAIDTKELIDMSNRFNGVEVEKFKKELGIKGENICLYIGSLYKEKKLEFLFEAGKIIHRNIPDFNLVVIGSGIDEGYVKRISDSYSWLHYLGPKFGIEKVPYFLFSKLLLMPGSVGLVILDSFALRIPIITTKNEDQAPELAYLENNVNGIIINDDISPENYAKTVVDVINDKKRLDLLIQGCKSSAEKYTIDAMVNNFVRGVIEATK